MEPSSLNSIRILGIRLDFPSDAVLEECAAAWRDGRNRQVCFLGLRDFMRARKPGEFASMIAGADLVLPTSPALVASARARGLESTRVFEPFRTLVRICSALEIRRGSVYLVGSDRRLLAAAEANLKSTFPGLLVVGRFPGSWRSSEEESLVEAVRKATPDLLVCGGRIPGGELWIPRVMPRFPSGTYVWSRDLIERFAGRRGGAHEGIPAGKGNGAKPSWTGELARGKGYFIPLATCIRFGIALVTDHGDKE